MKIKELKIGEGLKDGLHCFVSSVSEKTTKSGKPYIQVTLKDETGETKVNVWDTTKDSWDYKVNDVICVTGSVGEYNGSPQLEISSFRKTGKTLAEFTRQSERVISEMFFFLKVNHLEKFTNPFIKFLVERLILTGPFSEAFLKAPAARGMHHPWIGGLLEHVLGLCNLADSIYQNHYKTYFPKLDMEKVKFGLIFHDWGKVLEYDFSTPNLAYSERGVYQHHIGIVNEYLIRCSVAFEQQNFGSNSSDEFKTQREEHRKLLNELTHIIYSHHGQIEWSALMRPATPEALFVHWLDNFDAQIMNMRESLQKGPTGDIPGWTEKNWALGTQFKWQDVTLAEEF